MEKLDWSEAPHDAKYWGDGLWWWRSGDSGVWSCKSSSSGPYFVHKDFITMPQPHWSRRPGLGGSKPAEVPFAAEGSLKHTAFNISNPVADENIESLRKHIHRLCLKGSLQSSIGCFALGTLAALEKAKEEGTSSIQFESHSEGSHALEGEDEAPTTDDSMMSAKAGEMLDEMLKRMSEDERYSASFGKSSEGVFQQPMGSGALRNGLGERVNAVSPVDMVEHPQHYNDHPSGVECIEITEHMNFCLGNAMKYIWRADEKNDPIEDLKKAIWYIEREIKRRSE